jgi:hypothetical protein
VHTHSFDAVFDKKTVGTPQRVVVVLRSLVGTSEGGEHKSKGRVNFLAPTVVLTCNGTRRLIVVPLLESDTKAPVVNDVTVMQRVESLSRHLSQIGRDFAHFRLLPRSRLFGKESVTKEDTGTLIRQRPLTLGGSV